MDTWTRFAAALRLALSAALLVVACTGGWGLLGWAMAGAPEPAQRIEQARCDGTARVTIEDRIAWRLRCDGRLRVR